MTYFDLKQYLYETEKDGLIKSRTSMNGVKYKITRNGYDTLDELEKEIDLTVRKKIKAYLSENRQNLECESQFTGSCVKIGDNEYKLILRILENEAVIFEINLTVSNLKESEIAIQNWQKYAIELYKTSVDKLLNVNDISDE